MCNVRRWTNIQFYIAGLDHYQPIPTKGLKANAVLDARAIEHMVEKIACHHGDVQRRRKIKN